MHVGVMRLVLAVPGARSLKDKRQVVRSFKERVRARGGVSIAEVGALDKTQRAVLGCACVAREAADVERALEAVAREAAGLGEAWLADRAVEIMPFGEGGEGVTGDMATRFGDDAFAPDDEVDEENER